MFYLFFKFFFTKNCYGPNHFATDLCQSCDDAVDDGRKGYVLFIYDLHKKGCVVHLQLLLRFIQIKVLGGSSKTSSRACNLFLNEGHLVLLVPLLLLLYPFFKLVIFRIHILHPFLLWLYDCG